MPYTTLFRQTAHLKPVRCRVLCRLGTDSVITLLQIPPEMFTACYIYLPSIPIKILLFRRVYTHIFRPYHGPGVDSAPSENEYQEHSWR